MLDLPQDAYMSGYAAHNAEYIQNTDVILRSGSSACRYEGIQALYAAVDCSVNASTSCETQGISGNQDYCTVVRSTVEATVDGSFRGITAKNVIDSNVYADGDSAGDDNQAMSVHGNCVNCHAVWNR